MPRISAIPSYYAILSVCNLALVSFAVGKLAVPITAPLRQNKARGRLLHTYSGWKIVRGKLSGGAAA